MPLPMIASADAGMASGAKLRLRQLTKAFGTAKAVDQISLDVPPGAFVSFLGPSGSGKTTTLNLIAGFLTPDSGDIQLDERSIADVPPHKRNIGMVFQSYSLFPHMTVAENVGFPLRMRTRLSRDDARRRIGEMLGLVQLAHLGDRYPRQLSGGQQQRVAMARALVSHPRLLLMDEPLGALDKKLREQMQVEIKRIHRSVGTTVIYVTHDQTEALTMSDLVVVMHEARVAQVGTPRVLYEAPANLFVADFLGDSNLLAAKIVNASGDEVAVEIANGRVIRAARGAFAAAVGDRVVVLIRPEDMSVCASKERADGRDVLAGILKDISYHGDTFKLEVAIGADTLKVKVAREHGAVMKTGQEVFLTWKSAAVSVLPATDHPNTADDGAGR
jgi:putative spermidine/putrescine transport system ATP-binding protein